MEEHTALVVGDDVDVGVDVGVGVDDDNGLAGMAEGKGGAICARSYSPSSSVSSSPFPAPSVSWTVCYILHYFCWYRHRHPHRRGLKSAHRSHSYTDH